LIETTRWTKEECMLAIEEKLVDYIYETRYEDLLSELINIGKNLILTILGTTIAGAGTEGCETLVHQVEEWGGKEEATIWLHGSKVPAHNAVLVLCKAGCSMKERLASTINIRGQF
jgi:2-methylcitrate dehydratase PrpD